MNESDISPAALATKAVGLVMDDVLLNLQEHDKEFHAAVIKAWHDGAAFSMVTTMSSAGLIHLAFDVVTPQGERIPLASCEVTAVPKLGPGLEH